MEFQFLAKGIALAGCALGARLVHRSVYRKEEVFFQDIPNANDVYYSKVVAINSHKIAYVDKIFYHHRSNQGRHTLSTDRDIKKNYLFEAYDKIYEYITHQKDNLSLLRSFYNDVITNFNIYLGCLVYNTLLDIFKDIYLEKWKMLRREIVGELSCVNRVLYRNILNKSRNIKPQNVYMQAKVEFVRVLSERGCSVWGVGGMGSALLEELSKTDIKVQHVFDSASDKWGKKIYGYVVENFNEVQANHIIITTPQFYDEIAMAVGDQADNIYNLEEQIWMIPDEDGL